MSFPFGIPKRDRPSPSSYPTHESDPERITAIGRTDMDAIYSLIRAMADEGLITPTIGGIIDEDF